LCKETEVVSGPKNGRPPAEGSAGERSLRACTHCRARRWARSSGCARTKA